MLVVEDFHYLDPTVLRTLFQQWKVFVDEEISVVVAGTTHHAVDLAYANKDLVGRLTHIDATIWKKDDLAKIAYQGFGYLKLIVNPSIVETIASESVGLPIVMQATCLQLMSRLNITEPSDEFRTPDVTQTDAFDALNRVALDKFGAFESVYDRLARGLRKKRKYLRVDSLMLHRGRLSIFVH